MKKEIVRILNKIESSLEWVDVVALLTMWIISLAEVFFRDALNAPLEWSLGITILIMVWMAMIGSGTGVRSDLHIKISFFTAKLSKIEKKIASLISFGVIFYFGIYMILGAYSVAILPGIMPDLGISNAWLYIPVMIGGVLSMLFSLERALRLLLGKSEKLEEFK